MLKIVFQNLLVNSAHAMQGRGQIDVAISTTDGMCQIAVADTGPGIPDEIRDKVFTAFFTTKSRGSGLGLATAKRLVEAHQGEISVECPPTRRHDRHGPTPATQDRAPRAAGIGLIWLSAVGGEIFPLAARNSPSPLESARIRRNLRSPTSRHSAVHAGSARSAAASPRSHTMPKATILVVDDEALIRWSLTERLHSEGYDVLEAETGRRALEKLPEGVDLVLLDYRLPDTDGVSVLRKIKEFDQDILVILLTAYASVETAVEAMKLGAYHFANKPFNLDEVAATVERALETTRLRREVRQFRTDAARPVQPAAARRRVACRSPRCGISSRGWRSAPRRPCC